MNLVSCYQNTTLISNASISRANITHDTLGASRLLSNFLDEISGSSFFLPSYGAKLRSLYSKFHSISAAGDSYDITPDIANEKQGCVGVSAETIHILHVKSEHEDGTWGAGEEIDVSVRFSAPVLLIGGIARLRLEVGETIVSREIDGIIGEETFVTRFGYAPYIRGNGTATLHFRYGMYTFSL